MKCQEVVPSVECPEIFEALLVVAQKPNIDYSSLHALVTRLGSAIAELSSQASSDLRAAHESLMDELRLRRGLGFTAIWQYYAVHVTSLTQIESFRPSLGPSPASIPKLQSTHLSGAWVDRSLAFTVERRKDIFEIAVSFVSELSHSTAPIGVIDCETDEVRSAAEQQSEKLTTASSVHQIPSSPKNQDGLGRSLVCCIYNCCLDQHHSIM